eukprot:9436511-Alexandrium_andersonii.AAC.1
MRPSKENACSALRARVLQATTDGLRACMANHCFESSMKRTRCPAHSPANRACSSFAARSAHRCPVKRLRPSARPSAGEDS